MSTFLLPEVPRRQLCTKSTGIAAERPTTKGTIQHHGAAILFAVHSNQMQPNLGWKGN